MKCPFCRKSIADFLKHLAMTHDIKDIDQFRSEVEGVETIEDQKRKFSDFVSQLLDQRAKGQISAEEYRASVDKWLKERGMP